MRAADEAAMIAETATTAAVESTKKATANTWEYESQESPMGDGAIRTASLTSTTPLRLDFQYNGVKYPTLVMRHGKAKDVMFYVDRGQIIFHSGSSYSDRAIRMRVDEKHAFTVNGSESESRDSRVVFLPIYSRLLNELPTAKTLKIEVNYHTQGRFVPEFNVEDFDSLKVQ